MIKYEKDDKYSINLLCASLIAIYDAMEKINYKMAGLSLYDFASDWEIYDLVHRNMEIIGEAIKRLIPFNPATGQVVDKYGLIEAYPHIQWRSLAGIKDIIIHQYDDLNEELLFNIIKYEFSDLKNIIDDICKDEFIYDQINSVRSARKNCEKQRLLEYKQRTGDSSGSYQKDKQDK